tara:strand:+ start:6254 stop:7804 length:1551 start_codon:yes stop_codon:yes gene_type:complete
MPFFSESQALGTGSSPWTVNGNDLYPDSTSYIVGIGTTNPDTLLHLKAADGTAKIKLEGTSHAFLMKIDENQGGTADSNRYLVESDGTDGDVVFEFRNGNTSTTASTSFNIGGKSSVTLNLWDTDEGSGGKTKGVIYNSFANSRFYIFGEDGYAGGILTMDYLQSNDTRFAFGYGDQELTNAARLAIKHTSSPQLLLDDGTSTCSLTYADNSSAGYLLANTRLRLDANDNHLTFFDTDGGSNDVGSVLTYSEVATNQSKLRFHMNGASFDGNYIELQGGSSTRIQINQQEGADTVDAFLGIGGSGTEFQLGTGTADSTKIYTGNTAVAEFTSTGKLILTEDTAGGATQLELKNGAGDTASFAQNSTSESLDITTSDSMLRMYSTSASGSISFAKEDGTRVIKYDNSNGRFTISAGLALDTLDVSSATKTIANTDRRIAILCDTSSNAVTINLPAAADSDNRVFYIKDKGGNAGTTSRAITIDPNASETIDGAATVDIDQDYGSIQLICDGSNWFSI